VAPSSSTKKAARLTQRGKGKTVRFQGGTLFPFIVALVVVLGLGTVVYARQSQPAFDASPPTINQHWHAAYGFYICGEWYQLQGDQEVRNAQGQLTSTNYLQTGVHSHEDGVIHWHPFTSRAVGRRAVVGVFLDVYEVEFNNDRLKLPDNQVMGPWGAGAEFIPGETECDGEDAELSMVVWSSFEDTGSGTRYIANFENVRIQNDGMVFAFVFAPRNEPVPMPPWARDLPALGAVDITQFTPQDLIDLGQLPEDFDPSIFPEVDDDEVDDTDGMDGMDGMDDSDNDDDPADEDEPADN
jgi:hypothetical protein